MKRLLSKVLLMVMLMSTILSVPMTSYAASQGTMDFVTRCYEIALGREPDEAGLIEWSRKLTEGAACGVSVAYGFVYSEEFQNAGFDNATYTEKMYNMLLGRASDEEGKAYWVDQLNSGADRDNILSGFANSQEFYNLCDSYGIFAGHYVSGIGMDRNANINSFVNRFYEICLGRSGDISGQGSWVESLANGTMTGTNLAYGFIFSKEFIDKNTSDEEFVKTLYQTFLGREADTEGLKGWVEELEDNYCSREEVFNGFACSPEFDALCAQYGITRGEPIAVSNDAILNLTMFTASPYDNKLNRGNTIQEKIAELTGVRVKETWLTGQTAQEAIDSIIASGQLPDFIDGNDAMAQLYTAGVLVPWDSYIEKYPNLKELYSEEEWNMFRQPDGHIYWANVFNNTYGESRATGHNDEAFWIQARVLEWAGYPEIKTLDQYFNLIESYIKANPTLPDGTPNIGYTCLCDDWRYFCIENAGLFLAGYPNDGSVIVNTTDYEVPTIEDFNTSKITHDYLKKLNEVYNAGYMDVDFATQTYDEYIAKLSTGAVLGMCDQYWDFGYQIEDSFHMSGLDELGCEYVPLGLTADGVTEQRWHNYVNSINYSSGIAITTSCQNPDRAFRFLNDLLSQEIHDLRFWGIEGEDYLVGSDGLYYRTEEMRANWNDNTYRANHCCTYSYMPQWLGTGRDGKNAMQPCEQASEYYSTLSAPLANCLKAYQAEGFPDMIGSVVDEHGCWYPMYTYSNVMTRETVGGRAFEKMIDVKHEWLPRVVVSTNFEAEWNSYMSAYNNCNPQDFIDEMQEELDRRVAMG